MLDDESLILALADSHAGVRRQAIRMAERRLDGSPALLDAVLKRADDADPQVQLQLAYSLGEATDSRASAELARLLVKHQADAYLFAAAVSSVQKRNLSEIVRQVLELSPAGPAARQGDQCAGELAASLQERDAAGRLLTVIASPREGKLAPWQFATMAAHARFARSRAGKAGPACSAGATSRGRRVISPCARDVRRRASGRRGPVGGRKTVGSGCKEPRR